LAGQAGEDINPVNRMGGLVLLGRLQEERREFSLFSGRLIVGVVK